MRTEGRDIAVFPPLDCPSCNAIENDGYLLKQVRDAGPRSNGKHDIWSKELPNDGTMLTARIEIHLKKGVADPEGDNTFKALNLLGFKTVKQVRSAKIFEMALDAKDKKEARKDAEDMCRRLLANPVIHDYRIAIRAESSRRKR